MAIDTRDKRASVLGLGLAALLVLPEPGLIDQPDRQHVAYSYRGLAASAPAVLPDNIIEATVESNDPIRTLTSEQPERTITATAVTRTVHFTG